MTDLCPAEDSLLPLSGKDQHEETLKLTSLCPETNKESVFQVDEGYFTRHFSFGAESTGSQYYILKELLSAGEVNSSFSASEVALLCNQSEVEVVGAASLEQQVDTEAVEREATLKKRVAELEKQLEAAVCAHPQETQEQYTSDLRETIQLCETLMCEKAAIAADRDLIEQEFHALHEETQALRQEKEYLLRELEEKREVEEFRALEQESTRQYEKELLSEIISLKKAADKSATHVQNVESDIAAMSAELKRKEEWIMELQPLQNKDSAQEIRQLKRSLEDAETLNRDTKKEWAMLRTEMLALREKEVDMTADYKKVVSELQGLREQLKAEKMHFKRMQEDFQKELHKAFQENIKLSSLLREKDLNAVEAETITSLRKKLEQSEERERALQARLTKMKCSSKLPVKDNSSVKYTGDCNVEPYVMKGDEDSDQTCGDENDQQGASDVQLVPESLPVIYTIQEHVVIVDLQEEVGEKQFTSSKQENVNSEVSAPFFFFFFFFLQLQEELGKLQSCVTSLRQERDQLLEKLELLQEEMAQFRKLQKNGKMVGVQQCLDSELPSVGDGEQLMLQQQIHQLAEELEGIKKERDHLQARLETSLTAVRQENVALLEQRGSSSDHEELMSSLKEATLQCEVMRKRVVELEKAQVEAEDRVSTHKEAAQLLQIELQDAYAQLEEKDITISILEQKLAENQLDGGIALREMSNLEFQMDLERTALTAKHQEEYVKMAALLHSKEVTIKTLMEALGRMQKPADHQSLTESTRGRAVLSPMLVVQEEEVKQAKSDHYDGHVTTQRGQAAKWRRRATKLKENWSEVSSHTTPTRGHCISPSEGYLFESPKNKFFDGRNKTVPLSRPRQFFDNSSLGTIPEVAFPPTENGWAHLKDLSASVEDERELEPLSPKHDDNCKTQ
ncbi:hypothetical protein GN956_G1326 [Arapaima gigas]